MLTTSYFAVLLITDGIILITHRTTIIKYSKNHIYSGLIVAILSLLGYRQNMRLSELWLWGWTFGTILRICSRVSDVTKQSEGSSSHSSCRLLWKRRMARKKPPFPICDIIELVIVGRGHKTFRSILPAKNKVMQMMCSSKCMPAIRIYQLALSFAKRRIEFGNIRYFCCNSF